MAKQRIAIYVEPVYLKLLESIGVAHARDGYRPDDAEILRTAVALGLKQIAQACRAARVPGDPRGNSAPRKRPA